MGRRRLDRPALGSGGAGRLAQLHGRVETYLKQLCAEPPADVVGLVTHGDRFAEGSTLGRVVAATVSVGWLVSCLLVLAGLLAVATAGDVARAGRLAGCAMAGVLAAELVFRHARRWLGGVTGDVMGAMGEIATTVTLLAAAVVF